MHFTVWDALASDVCPLSVVFFAVVCFGHIKVLALTWINTSFLTLEASGGVLNDASASTSFNRATFMF